MENYTPVQIEKMLSSLEIVVDTREQDTKAFRERVEGFGHPFIRGKLDYGDYSAIYCDPDGNIQTLAQVAAIERKMSLDELCNCFTKERPRFQREFERAGADGCRIHLIVENGNYEYIKHGKYRSKLSPQSLIASHLSWSIRYDTKLHFCKPETTGWMIGEIMHYELREHLLSQCAGVTA